MDQIVEMDDKNVSESRASSATSNIITYAEPTVFDGKQSIIHDQQPSSIAEAPEKTKVLSVKDTEKSARSEFPPPKNKEIIQLDDDEPAEKFIILEKGSEIRALASGFVEQVSEGAVVLGDQDLIEAEEPICEESIPSSSTMPIPLNYIAEVCEVKAAMKIVYDNVNMGRLNKAFKESVLGKMRITADWPSSTTDYDLKPFVPVPLREKHSFLVERHLRIALAKEQREKRTSYVIKAGADEVVARLHHPDPVGLRVTCNSLTKRIATARGWDENVPNADDVYRMIINLDRHLRIALAKEQREKRTSYVIKAGADEVVARLHHPDPVGLRVTCNSLTKRIATARGWDENVPNADDVYRMIINLDVDELLNMARLLLSKRPYQMRRIFKNATVGPLRSEFIVSTLKQLKISQDNPSDLHSMNVRWIVPVELVAVQSAADTICARIKVAVEVAQLNDRIEYFIAYHANEILNLRMKQGRTITEAKITKMLGEVITVNEWKANIPSISIIAARIEALSTRSLWTLCPGMNNSRFAKNNSSQRSSTSKDDEPEVCDLMVIWDDTIKYAFI
ncbi:hypothetical protein Tcan_15946 [Toxocara canis]|uniref:Uncharacterized protein n=1 Tax=Toxocara canis TaxID=6265 RepID=A0A0B2VB02_TOXCA|nr:hypothetical protein Tcan_15946 [Toxocara canis]